MSRFFSTWILFTVVLTAAATPCEATGQFSLGAGYARYRESSAMVWDPSWFLAGAYFFDIMPGLQLGLTAEYHFLEVKPAYELFGCGTSLGTVDGDGWMFSLVPALRVPFSVSEDGSTQVYLQGGVGWYHVEMDVLFTGHVIEPASTEIEERVIAKWAKPGIDGRFGVVTRLHKALFLELSPGISVIFTDVDATFSLSAYAALTFML